MTKAFVDATNEVSAPPAAAPAADAPLAALVAADVGSAAEPAVAPLPVEEEDDHDKEDEAFAQRSVRRSRRGTSLRDELAASF